MAQGWAVIAIHEENHSNGIRGGILLNPWNDGPQAVGLDLFDLARSDHEPLAKITSCYGKHLSP